MYQPAMASIAVRSPAIASRTVATHAASSVTSGGRTAVAVATASMVEKACPNNARPHLRVADDWALGLERRGVPP